MRATAGGEGQRWARDLSEILPPMMIGRLAADLFQGRAGATQALGLMTPEGIPFEGFEELGKRFEGLPERGWKSGAKALIRESAAKMAVVAMGSGKATALRLPVSWEISQLSSGSDWQGGSDKAAVFFLALFRVEPDGGGAPANLALFGAYRFDGWAASAAAARSVRPEGSLRVSVIGSVAELLEAAADFDNPARQAGSDFVAGCGLTESLDELLNPAFYERRELAAAAKGAAPGGRRGL